MSNSLGDAILDRCLRERREAIERAEQAETALQELLHEPHHLGYAVSGKTGTYDTSAVLIRRDWYERLMAFRRDSSDPSVSG